MYLEYVSMWMPVTKLICPSLHVMHYCANAFEGHCMCSTFIWQVQLGLPCAAEWD